KLVEGYLKRLTQVKNVKSHNPLAWLKPHPVSVPHESTCQPGNNPHSTLPRSSFSPCLPAPPQLFPDRQWLGITIQSEVRIPMAPFQPIWPMAPFQPIWPMAPFQPIWPMAPFQPIWPMAPFQPIWPMAPFQPIWPMAPFQPIWPMAPFQPIWPMAPFQPIWPMAPFQPI
uniref:Uncharacterized protein n=1 Tax=Oncorhynchus tshawytscha TaxID=74940 RepID=A0AAZ3QUY1_ONCTS